MYDMKNLAPAQLTYFKNRLAKHNVKLNAIKLDQDKLVLSQSLDPNRNVSITVVKDGHTYRASRRSPDQKPRQFTNSIIYNVISDAVEN